MATVFETREIREKSGKVKKSYNSQGKSGNLIPWIRGPRETKERRKQGFMSFLLYRHTVSPSHLVLLRQISSLGKVKLV